MESIGEYLRKSREQNGISLEEVAYQTRVSLRMLKALEVNDFGQIPSEVSARGFVRSYAKCLGLNEAGAIKKFQDTAADFYTRIPAPEGSQDEVAGGSDKPGRLKKAIPFAVLAGTAVIMLVIFYGQPRFFPKPAVQGSVVSTVPVGDEREAIATEAQGAVKPPKPVEPVPVPQQAPVAPSPEPKPAPPMVERPQTGLPADLTLVITATEQSWVLARIDQDISKEVLLQPGERIRWNAAEKFVLTLGNAGGVLLEFNGEPLEPLGQPGQVVRDFTLTR